MYVGVDDQGIVACVTRVGWVALAIYEYLDFDAGLVVGRAFGVSGALDADALTFRLDARKASSRAAGK